MADQVQAGQRAALPSARVTRGLVSCGIERQSLARRHELQPIAKHDAKKVTAVAYVSKDFLKATVGAPDWEVLADLLSRLLTPAPGLSE